MLTQDVDTLESAEDSERRRLLRSFLMDCRSQIGPGEVGLPKTTRRRVQGLRRGEVAELIGVSVDWYRYFESGRPVRVSTRFVTRLSTALRLTASQQADLFRLALPEIYHLSGTTN